MISKTKLNIIAIFTILTWTTLIYINTFDNSFHYDDERVILYNQSLKNISNFTNIFSPQSYMGMGNRPISDLTLALNYHFNEFNVFGYHLVNLLIHLAVCILVYFIANKLLSRANQYCKIEKNRNIYQLFPLFSSLLYALHPINTQSVNYISARSSTLCVLFMLISVFLFIIFLESIYSFKTTRNNAKSRIIQYFLSVICFAGLFFSFFIALGCREMAIAVPIILLIYDLCFYSGKRNATVTEMKTNSNRSELGENRIGVFISKSKHIFYKFKLYNLPFLIIIVLGGIVLTKTGKFELMVPWHIDAIAACKAYVYYIKLLFLPINLSVDHYFPLPVSIFQISSIISICIVISLITLGVYLLRISRVISFSIFLYFITPIATSSVLLVTYGSLSTMIAEHRIYASAIGFCIPVVLVICDISKYIEERIAKYKPYKNPGNMTNRQQFIQIALIMPILISCSIATIKRNTDWRDDLTLWKRAVDYYPESARAQYNLGLEYTKRKLWDKSIIHYMESLKWNFNDFQTHNNLGISFKETGMLDSAINEFRIAITLSDKYPDGRLNLALALEVKGLIEEAISEYKIALECKPDNIIAMYNLGNIYMAKNDLDNAKSMFSNVLNILQSKSFADVEIFDRYYLSSINALINHDKKMLHTQSLNNLGILYMRMEEIDNAIVVLKKAMEVDPGDVGVHNNLGWAYYKKGELGDAENEFRTVLTLDTDMVQAHNAIGIIYNNKGLYNEAIKEFQAVITLKSDYAEAYKNLGLIYNYRGDVKNAISHLNETLRLSPNQQDADKIRLILQTLN